MGRGSGSIDTDLNVDLPIAEETNHRFIDEAPVAQDGHLHPEIPRVGEYLENSSARQGLASGENRLPDSHGFSLIEQVTELINAQSIRFFGPRLDAAVKAALVT
jgi:hypothetical protein